MDHPEIWVPDILDLLAGHLPGNSLPFLRLVDKATAAHFAAFRTVRLSELIPPREFVWFLSSSILKSLNSAAHRHIATFTARSGSIENLTSILTTPVALADWRHCVLDAAARSGHMDVFHFLIEFYSTTARTDAALLGAAADAGQSIAVCEELASATGNRDFWTAAIRAASGGHVGLMDHFLGRLPRLEEGALEVVNEKLLIIAAASGCDLRTLKRLKMTYGPAFVQAMPKLPAAAARSEVDFQEKIIWLEAQGCDKPWWTCGAAMRMPDAIERVQWLRQRAYPATAWDVVEEAVVTNDIQRVQYALRLFADDPWYPLELVANFYSNDVAILDAITRSGIAVGPRHLWHAARTGALPAMEWLVEKLGPGALNEEVAYAAASGGSMASTVWLYERGCPWDTRTFLAATLNGSEEMVEFLATHGCPMDVDAFAAVAVRGNTMMLDCLRRAVDQCMAAMWSTSPFLVVALELVISLSL
ncbi:hypothetical protein TSOC_012806 [Tetrabaena socialis]|uniref:Ankyrin repeat domain-containing protein n=1 Tax=Tetrabaena socialis TaxID=47790 RepID=A0A2J7ZM29_9CHLO|nr:hypothetical protein TSOC_012806 [Tetrabaena socialis]|eukprot:PNH01317.1 hypothetical protein TSOC_012806 [Tetrabaena socialis]